MPKGAKKQQHGNGDKSYRGNGGWGGGGGRGRDGGGYRGGRRGGGRDGAGGDRGGRGRSGGGGSGGGGGGGGVNDGGAAFCKAYMLSPAGCAQAADASHAAHSIRREFCYDFSRLGGGGGRGGGAGAGGRSSAAVIALARLSARDTVAAIDQQLTRLDVWPSVADAASVVTGQLLMPGRIAALAGAPLRDAGGQPQLRTDGRPAAHLLVAYNERTAAGATCGRVVAMDGTGDWRAAPPQMAALTAAGSDFAHTEVRVLAAAVVRRPGAAESTALCASGGADGHINVWCTQTGGAWRGQSFALPLTHTRAITALHLHVSADGERVFLFSASEDLTVCQWELSSEHFVRLHRVQPASADLAERGRSLDELARMHAGGGGAAAAAAAAPVGHVTPVMAIATWTSEETGALYAVTAAIDGSVKVWNFSTGGEPRHEFDAPPCGGACQLSSMALLRSAVRPRAAAAAAAAAAAEELRPFLVLGYTHGRIELRALRDVLSLRQNQLVLAGDAQVQAGHTRALLAAHELCGWGRFLTAGDDGRVCQLRHEPLFYAAAPPAPLVVGVVVGGGGGAAMEARTEVLGI